jgi:hypothetical protein
MFRAYAIELILQFDNLKICTGIFQIRSSARLITAPGEVFNSGEKQTKPLCL